jgi:hypothetical protein
VVFAQSEDATPHCVPVGGTVMTNLAVVDPSTTLGTATGDLAGAVAATILGAVPGANGSTVFTVQHHWVTTAGDTVLTAPAKATAVNVKPTLFAIVSYPIEIVGGTGRFADATGHFDAIGEIDVPNFPSSFAGGRTIFRYRGQVCFKAPSEP